MNVKVYNVSPGAYDTYLKLGVRWLDVLIAGLEALVEKENRAAVKRAPNNSRARGKCHQS